ncbi:MULTISPECIES: metallophosphoesterase [Bacillus]|uniref:metallophosphoesterase n=1 Tax=Bacillus TaxID=1386 RepID=UPI0002FF41FC|nr:MULTISPECIES: metallophosphoesterase [Bacillus]
MLYIVLLFVFLLLLLLVYMWSLANENNVIKHEIVFDELPNSFGTIRIFFISDIHKRMVNNEVIEKTKGKVDLVIIGGDLAEKGVPFSRIEANIKKLRGLAPCYFVWGNNDYELDYHQLDATLLSLGVKVLDNTAVLFESNTGDKLSLLGVDYYNHQRDRLDLALSDSDPTAFKILASHCPRIVKKIKEEHQISLVLSGHTHGGQIRIFGLGRYKKGGIVKKGRTVVLTSNGYGTSLVPFRLGAKSETHLINISSSK